MKTAVSIPNDLFDDAERLAKTFKKFPHQLYTHALREYVARHAPDNVTDTLNEVCSEVGDELDGFISSASRRTLGRSKWQLDKARSGGRISLNPLAQSRGFAGRFSWCM